MFRNLFDWQSRQVRRTVSLRNRQIRRSAFRDRVQCQARKMCFEPLEDRRLLTTVLDGVPDWVARGPSPSIDGQVENIDSTGPGADPVVGAIHTLALHPSDGDIAYLGGVNGGVWRSTNFLALNPIFPARRRHLGPLGLDPALWMRGGS